MTPAAAARIQAAEARQHGGGVPKRGFAARAQAAAAKSAAAPKGSGGGKGKK